MTAKVFFQFVFYSIFLLSIVGYQTTYHGFDRELSSTAPPTELSDSPGHCTPFPRHASVFVTINAPVMAVTFLIGENFFEIQPALQLSMPFVQIGVQDELPLNETSSKYLYFVVKNEKWPAARRYCFDLEGQSIEIAPAQIRNSNPLRVFVDMNGMHVRGDDKRELVQYHAEQDRTALIIDTTDEKVTYEIKAIDSFTDRLIKPEPKFKFCAEAQIAHKDFFRTGLICISDGLEFVLGIFPNLLGRVHPMFGLVALFLVDGAVLVFLWKKIWTQNTILGIIFFCLAIAWIGLFAFCLWPYALLYP